MLLFLGNIWYPAGPKTVKKSKNLRRKKIQKIVKNPTKKNLGHIIKKNKNKNCIKIPKKNIYKSVKNGQEI